ncbi:hypothetical protein KOR34_24380 [Posidoniimonas corsicana]|uniref:Uncharacterized protein n=1 Tax=Posidoniimonas corsicana TaxID=1938618 RepID=A0A5C5VFZ3_9BACT|nr:hypothetical protein [Posidoniimonas corsicana]TWT37486.1 hypothetical protein KOR34_24380 [Posidoniimonas corsicana]
MVDDSELFDRVRQYADARQLRVTQNKKLGYGTDGTVWVTSNSAVKAVHRYENYYVERASYERLAEADISSIGRFAVPRLIDSDDSLQIVEMEIVEPPYVLDFGKVYLDAPPFYWRDPQLRKNAYDEWRERFDSHWEEVASVVYELERHGIYYIDPRPSNINTDGLD